jgi:hypothetical protein
VAASATTYRVAWNDEALANTRAAIIATGTHIAARPALAGAYAELLRQRIAPPFLTMGDYVRAMHARRHFAELMSDERKHRVYLAEVRNSVSSGAITQLDDLWRRGGFDQKAQDALVRGATLALVLGLAGAALGPIGAVVGAVVGLCIGIAEQCLPIREWELIDTWRKIVKALTVEERFACLGGMRVISDRACDHDHIPHYPSWAFIHDDELGTRSGQRNVVFILLQTVLELDCWPEPADSSERVGSYESKNAAGNLVRVSYGARERRLAHAVAAYCCDLQPHQALKESRDFYHLVKSTRIVEGGIWGVGGGTEPTGTGSVWIVPALVAAQELRAVDLRATARAMGVPDLGLEG